MNDFEFGRSLPAWAAKALIISVPLFFLGFLGYLFLPKHSLGQELLLSVCLTSFGIISAVITFQGIKTGYLPYRFLVSISKNPTQFWLTIIFTACFSVGLLLFGATSLVIVASKLVST